MRLTPFEIAVPRARLDEVLGRLEGARWPNLPDEPAWAHGVDDRALRDLIDHILKTYDWRAQEARLNCWPQFIAEVDSQQIHFVHAKADDADAPTVMLIHGWPGAFSEFMASVDRLTHPERYGGDARDALSLVIPSLPGYAFSPAPRHVIGAPTMARLMDALLTQGLGLGGYMVQGGDYGAVVACWMAYRQSACRALHLNYNGWLKLGQTPETPDEQAALDRWRVLADDDGAYAHLARTQPSNLAFAFADSPLGAAAWIFARYKRGIDDLWSVYDKDELSTTIMLYLLTGSLPSSMLSYRGLVTDEQRPADGLIHTPTAFARFPRELASFPRSFLAKSFTNIARWTDLPAGGHFAAMEQPKLFSEDLLAFRRQLRDQGLAGFGGADGLRT